MPAEVSNEATRPPSFSLREIASWAPWACSKADSTILASIPALQRGLVWSPQQNELLWDSILRGFPIGAIVVTKWSERLKKTTEAQDCKPVYHLLDGQQRCNAIALGFLDSFSGNESTDCSKVKSILWLDLNPAFERDSTRNFWVRATTTAHPWGYRRDDAATPLAVRDIRAVLQLVGLNPADPEYRRPRPENLWPCDAAANTPIPLSWLLELPTHDESIFWTSIATRAASAKLFQWANKVSDFCVDHGNQELKTRIFSGIQRAHAARVMALVAPEELLDASEQEKINSIDREDVSNIEQLFQRLNRQGTKLDGEELAYSMIKAYWPVLEEPIDEASKDRMPQARMVSLGVRAALAQNTEESLPGSPTVSALRAIARGEKGKKEVIQTFITQDLGRACHLIDQWLKYDPVANPTGLLPVHITSIAINSREVFLLLLHFAQRATGHPTPERWPQYMQALATIIHWFAVDKTKVVNRVFARCRSDGAITVENIRAALTEARKEKEMHLVHPPNAVESFIQVPDDDLGNWTWWLPIRGDGATDGIESRRQAWEGFLNFRQNREILMYAQRDFLARRFPDYDPGRRDLWEAHNRPWDFDHILASYYFYNRKDGSNFRNICGQWGYTIANLRAWPFEENRSDQAQTAAGKVGDSKSIEDSFLLPEDVLAFSGGDNSRHDESSARSFVCTCRARLFRIYRSWYESTGVADIFASDEHGSPIPPES